MTGPTTGYLRTTREARTRRRLEVARLLRDTPAVTDIELAKALHVNRDTIHDDRQALMLQVNADTQTELQVWRAEHIEELEKLREALQDLLIPAEKRVELALKIIAQDAKFKGTEAPSRSESVNVTLDGDAIGPYRQFVQASLGLTGEQFETLLRLAREMPRLPFEQVAPPLSSPLWLTEGETDENA
jgi:hypothetical protein